MPLNFLKNKPFEKAYSSTHLVTMSVGIANLPSSFEGFKLLHVSDIHITPKTPKAALFNLVDTINALDIDMVALTGDIFDAKIDTIESHYRILAQIHHPVYCVSGNHDLLFARKDLKSIIEKLGFINMDNRIITLTKGAQTLQLVGLSDAYSHFFGIKREEKTLFSKLDASKPAILLAHQPKDVKFVKNFNIALQLSGHTHGGQIYPFGYLVRLVQPYLKGLHVKGRTKVFVTTGYGSWGFDFRFLTPSEIVLIKLTKES